jgi:hypothetical protein
LFPLVIGTLAICSSGCAKHESSTVPTATQSAAGACVQSYKSIADIPQGFYASGSPDYVEDFEDGAANNLKVEGPGLYITPKGKASTDSVDADDGAIDGHGSLGRSAWTDANAGNQQITLDAPATAVGVVLTDGLGRWIVDAFDSNAQLVASSAEVELVAPHTGETDEDTFVGFHHDTGIKVLVLRKVTPGASGLETDHIQYGSKGAGPTGGCAK